MKELLRYTLSLDFPFKTPLPEMVLDKDGDWVDYYEAKMLLNKFQFRPINTLGETHKHVLLLYKGNIYMKAGLMIQKKIQVGVLLSTVMRCD